MTLNLQAQSNLHNYIKNNEVVYQVYGDLVEVANNKNSENRKSLLNYSDNASSVEVYQKGAQFIHEPFEDLDNWSTEADTLFLLETIGVLVCIPTKIAIQENIIKE